jgi:hypothetical protein
MDWVPVTEAAEVKATVMSRGLGALAAARLYFPGVLVSLIIAVAATFLSEHYGGPVMLFALLLGMAFFFSRRKGRASPVSSLLQNAYCASLSGCSVRRLRSPRS